jgi:Protein of unknown function (DUF2924)
VTSAPRHQKARREGEAAGPSRQGTEETTVEARIIALDALATDQLRIEWQMLYRATPPTRLSRDLLMRGVAYKIQEQTHGGLSLRSRRVLRSFAGGSDEPGRSRAAPAINLRPGTKLVREWHQLVHTVSVLEDGFEYRGERYRSLSQIARRITGVHWSGPLFFGISKRRAVEAAGG